YRGNSSGGESFLITVPLVTTYTDATVTNGVTYYYKVSATNAIGEGPKSNEASATPSAPATPPGAPQGLSATPGDTTVSLTWSPPTSNGGSPITNYLIYRGTTSEGETLVQTLPVVLAYTDSGLTNGQPYFYEVTAKNGVGQGPRSNEATATPAAGQTVPSAPRSLSAVPGDGLIGLTWLAPSSDGGSPITTYNVYRGTTPRDESQPALAAAVTVTTHTAPSATHRYTH